MVDIYWKYIYVNLTIKLRKEKQKVDFNLYGETRLDDDTITC